MQQDISERMYIRYNLTVSYATGASDISYFPGLEAVHYLGAEMKEKPWIE